jgi:hypothetical protein
VLIADCKQRPSVSALPVESAAEIQQTKEPAAWEVVRRELWMQWLEDGLQEVGVESGHTTAAERISSTALVINWFPSL